MTSSAQEYSFPVPYFNDNDDMIMNNQQILYDSKACFKFISKAGTATINYEDLEPEAS